MKWNHWNCCARELEMTFREFSFSKNKSPISWFQMVPFVYFLVIYTLIKEIRNQPKLDLYYSPGNETRKNLITLSQVLFDLTYELHHFAKSQLERIFLISSNNYSSWLTFFNQPTSKLPIHFGLPVLFSTHFVQFFITTPSSLTKQFDWKEIPELPL